MKQVHVSQQERVFFHPVVKMWLEDRGYKALHEVWLRRLIPDFIAIKEDHTLIVECKLGVGSKSVDGILWKLSHYGYEYQRQYPANKYHLVLASPSFDKESIATCHHWGVGTLRIDY